MKYEDIPHAPCSSQLTRPRARWLCATVLPLLSSAANADITGTTGAHTQIAPPATMPTSDTTAYCWDELQDVVLTVDLDVDAVSPSVIAPTTIAPTAIVIPAGTRVSSHMLHGQPASSAATLLGSTLFGEPVIAVIWSDARLDASDPVLGATATTYPTGTSLRGLEDVVAPDSLSFSHLEVETEMSMTTVLDQVRVLTAGVSAFSLDLGSDTEFSDRNADGDEVHDCGDMLIAGTGAVALVHWDDVNFLLNTFPDLATPAPYGGSCMPPGPETQYAQALDLDGFDQIAADLTTYSFPLLQADMTESDRLGIHDLANLRISYDDDKAIGWTACAPARTMPVDSRSPAGTTWGRNVANDEVVDLLLDATATSYPLPVLSMTGAARETGVHTALTPNPNFGQAGDDDVDALDWLDVGGNAYISVDQEGYGASSAIIMEPSSIYLTSSTGTPVLVADAGMLGIPVDTDLDAFEFVWASFGIEDAGPTALAVVFSVDEDDSQTIGLDESGRTGDPSLNASDLYLSFLDGSRYTLVTGLADDVDAIATLPTLEEELPTGD